jgi:hypothetical protein
LGKYFFKKISGLIGNQKFNKEKGELGLSKPKRPQ